MSLTLIGGMTYVFPKQPAESTLPSERWTQAWRRAYMLWEDGHRRHGDLLRIVEPQPWGAVVWGLTPEDYISRTATPEIDSLVVAPIETPVSAAHRSARIANQTPINALLPPFAGGTTGLMGGMWGASMVSLGQVELFTVLGLATAGVMAPTALMRRYASRCRWLDAEDLDGQEVLERVAEIGARFAASNELTAIAGTELREVLWDAPHVDPEHTRRRITELHQAVLSTRCDDEQHGRPRRPATRRPHKESKRDIRRRIEKAVEAERRAEHSERVDARLESLVGWLRERKGFRRW